MMFSVPDMTNDGSGISQRPVIEMRPRPGKSRLKTSLFLIIYNLLLLAIILATIWPR